MDRTERFEKPDLVSGFFKDEAGPFNAEVSILCEL